MVKDSEVGLQLSCPGRNGSQSGAEVSMWERETVCKVNRSATSRRLFQAVLEFQGLWFLCFFYFRILKVCVLN